MQLVLLTCDPVVHDLTRELRVSLNLIRTDLYLVESLEYFVHLTVRR